MHVGELNGGPASRADQCRGRDEAVTASLIGYRYDTVECDALYAPFAPGARVEVDVTKARDSMTGAKLKRLQSPWTKSAHALGLLGLSCLWACSETFASPQPKSTSPFASERFQETRVEKRNFPTDDLLKLLGDENGLGLPRGAYAAAGALMRYATGAKRPRRPFCVLKETDIRLPKNQSDQFIGSAPWDLYSPSEQIFVETKKRLAVIEDGIDPMASKQERTNFFPLNGKSDCSKAGMFAQIENITVGLTPDDYEHSAQADLVSFEEGRFVAWYSLSLREEEEVSVRIEVPHYNSSQQLQALNVWFVDCYLDYSCQAERSVNSAASTAGSD